MTLLRNLTVAVAAMGALSTACSTAVDEPPSGSQSSSSGIEPLPGQPVAQLTAPAPAPRDGRCEEIHDATSICSLQGDRSHLFGCAVGGQPPKPLPECKSVGSTHWCCR